MSKNKEGKKQRERLELEVQRLESALASAQAEVALAQQRTRDIEQERARLEGASAVVTMRLEQQRVGNVSAVVSLIGHLGIAKDVLKTIGERHGWHEADDLDNCERCT